MSHRSKSYRKRGSTKQNQRGGTNQSGQGEIQISQETLQQAGAIAQKMLNQAMSQGNNSQPSGQVGGSALAGLPHVPQTGGNSGAQTAPAVAEAAITGGAIAGANAGAVAAADALSSLGSSPLMGGGRRRGSGKGKGRKLSSSSMLSSNKNRDPTSQKGGMVPGLMTAVETALVPLGLYLGQKALQSRKSGNRSLGRFVDFGRRGRSSSRRTRRRSRR